MSKKIIHINTIVVGIGYEDPIFMCEQKYKPNRAGEDYIGWYGIQTIEQDGWIDKVTCQTCKWKYLNQEETTERLNKEKEMSNEIYKAVRAVYEKTEEAILVTEYSNVFGLGDSAVERSIMFLEANKAAVLKRCKQLRQEEDERNAK